MKKSFISLCFLLAIGVMSFGQATDQLVSKCAMNAGADSRYLKDFRIQLGKATSKGELRYKVKMSLWKNTKYRFTMCNSDDSKGKLIFSVQDETNKLVLSSYDLQSGKIYPVVDFVCQKSGIYLLSYDFTDGEQGTGVGVVSMVK
jgi:hypothetical protein